MGGELVCHHVAGLSWMQSAEDADTGALGIQQVTKDSVHCGMAFHTHKKTLCFDFLIFVILDSYWSQMI